MSKTISNPTAVTELTLYVENSHRVYDMLLDVVHNLQKKYSKGIFDSEKAVKAFEHVAEYAAKEYVREFRKPSKWYDIFTAATRKEAAEDLLERYMENITRENDM